MMQDLGVRRHPFASATRHPLYRAQAERWLECLVRNDVTRVGGVLDSRFVYAQVFAGSGAEHGIIDVLTITRTVAMRFWNQKPASTSTFPYRLRTTGYGCVAIWSLVSFAATAGCGNSRRAATGLSGRSRLAFPSGDQHFAGCAVATNRSGSRWLDGKLAARHSRSHAAIATYIATRQKINRHRITGGRRLKDRRKTKCPHPVPTCRKYHRGCSNCHSCDSRRGNGR